MAATSDLELVQCVAFAVKMCKAKEFTVLRAGAPKSVKIVPVDVEALIDAQINNDKLSHVTLVTKNGYELYPVPQPKPMDVFSYNEKDASRRNKARDKFRTLLLKMLRKEATALTGVTENDIANLYILNKEQYFFDLFNHHVVSRNDGKALCFFLDDSLTRMVVVPDGAPLTTTLMDIIPKMYKNILKIVPESLRQEYTSAIQELGEGIKKYKEKRKDIKAKQGELKIFVEDAAEDEIVDTQEQIDLMEKQLDDLQYTNTQIQTKISSIAQVFVVRERQKVYGDIVPHLRKDFPFSEMFRLSTRPYKVEPTKTFSGMSVSPTLRKIWNTANTLLPKLAPNETVHYLFLDQEDAFTKTIKDATLKRLLQEFGLSGLNPELLSPVDVFMVNKDKKDSIQQEITKKLLKHKDVAAQYLSNTEETPTTYHTIMMQYFDSKDLIGISLKLPEKVESPPFMKVISKTPSNSMHRDLSEAIDPFTLFLAKITPQTMDDMIDKLIEIDYGNFDVRPEKLSWEYPVKFHYKNLVKDYEFPAVRFKDMTLEFRLQTWTNAGFNGQWAKNQTHPVPSNWTGGYGMSAANHIFSQYTEYRQSMVKELVNIREKAFIDTVDEALLQWKALGLPSERTAALNKLQAGTLYQDALTRIRAEKIIGRTTEMDSRPIIRLFRVLEDENVMKARLTMTAINIMRENDPALKKSMKQAYDNAEKKFESELKRGGKTPAEIRMYSRYRVRVIELLLSDMKTVSGSWAALRLRTKQQLRAASTTMETNLKYLEAHYVASQFAWFLFYGGRAEKLLLKKKIFLSVFGVITKSGYKIFEKFENGELQGIKDIFRKKIQSNTDTRSAYMAFTGAPYVVFT